MTLSYQLLVAAGAWFFQVTQQPWMPAKKQRKHMEKCSTRGVVIGLVSGVQPLTDQWLMPFGQKKEMFGSMRIPLGGATADPEAETQKGRRKIRSDADFEPSSFHCMSFTIYDELLHQYEPCGVIDLCPVGSELAELCIQRGTPYLGICFTEKHMSLLRISGFETTCNHQPLMFGLGMGTLQA